MGTGPGGGWHECGAKNPKIPTRLREAICELDRFQFVTGSLETKKTCGFVGAVIHVFFGMYIIYSIDVVTGYFLFRSSVLGNRYSMDQHGWNIDENSTSLKSVLNFASKLKRLQLWVHQIRGETAEPGIRFCLVPLFNRHLLHSNISFLQNSLKLTQHPQKRLLQNHPVKINSSSNYPFFSAAMP